jgi:phosphoglycolate phosphatase
VTRTIVFDMDGTLVQTRAASWEVFQDTAVAFDLPIRSAEEFFELFRGNFYESLTRLCSDPAVEAAVRQHFMTGLRERYSPRFIPGMVNVVRALASRYPLAVMSSNAMVAIRRILETEGVAQCFAHVFSGEVGASKEAHLRVILADPSYGEPRHCSPTYVEGAPSTDADVVLVTDTVGDVREAQRCGVRTLGVAWGMHSIDALLEAGAESVALWPQELLTILLPDGPAAEGACSCTSAGACSSSAPAAARSGSEATRAWPWAAAAAATAVRRERRPEHRPGTPVAGTAPRVGNRPDLVLAAALSRIAAAPAAGPRSSSDQTPSAQVPVPSPALRR